MKFIITTALLSLLSIVSSGQFYVTPYISTGPVNHLSRNGLNYEIGFENEFFKRVDVSINYRYMKIGNEISVSAVSTNLSYIIISRNNHRLMLGPGFSYGKYKRMTDTYGYDKEHTSTWIDWGKIRYDYTLKNNIRLGIVGSLSGEDGDGSTFFGIVLGYKLQ